MSCLNVTKDEIILHASSFVKHDGYCHRTGPLFYALHSLRDELYDRKLRIIFSDGEPFEITGFDFILKTISKNFGLSNDRIIIDIVDHWPRYSCDYATVNLLPDPGFRWGGKVLLDQCILDSDAVLFGGIYRRFTPSRALMAYMLETELHQDAFVICGWNFDFLEFEFQPFYEKFQDLHKWYKNRVEVKKDLPSHGNGFDDGIEAIVGTYHRVFPKYQIEIIMETNTQAMGWFTEKTTKCLISGKPFIIYSTSHALARLRELGFHTFENFIDESYDTITDDQVRFDCVQNEIRRISRLDLSSRQSLLQELQHIATYNKENYLRLTKEYYRCFTSQN